MKFIARQTFDSAQLLAEHPPRLRNRNKEVVFEIARGNACESTLVTFSRWAAMSTPQSLVNLTGPAVAIRDDVYDYEPAWTSAGAVMEWHVNFADPRLFVAYGSGLFAQDEVQVAEHPVLASLKEALDAAGEPALTVDNGSPTPILIRGAQRCVAIATDPDWDAGRPYGLYGNRFAAASPDVITRATRCIVPPTITNLIAIAAPSGGQGAYTRQSIEHVLTTAFTAFQAAKLESAEAAGTAAASVVHTGFWGCGAFGGNRTLMPLLQILAARLASVDLLVLHAFSQEGSRVMHDALTLAERLIQPQMPLADIITQITALKLRWGQSDGN